MPICLSSQHRNSHARAKKPALRQQVLWGEIPAARGSRPGSRPWLKRPLFFRSGLHQGRSPRAAEWSTEPIQGRSGKDNKYGIFRLAGMVERAGFLRRYKSLGQSQNRSELMYGKSGRKREGELSPRVLLGLIYQLPGNLGTLI